MALVKDLPDYQRLTSVPGIGLITTLTILAQAGELRRFAHHRQFLTFCEMDRAMIQSGPFRGQTKRSKYANARLRRTLWMAGQISPSAAPWVKVCFIVFFASSLWGYIPDRTVIRTEH